MRGSLYTLLQPANLHTTIYLNVLILSLVSLSKQHNTTKIWNKLHKVDSSLSPKRVFDKENFLSTRVLHYRIN